MEEYLSALSDVDKIAHTRAPLNERIVCLGHTLLYRQDLLLELCDKLVLIRQLYLTVDCINPLVQIVLRSRSQHVLSVFILDFETQFAREVLKTVYLRVRQQDEVEVLLSLLLILKVIQVVPVQHEVALFEVVLV